MAEESTQQYLSSIDVDKKLISSIDNGIVILDSELKIRYFNKWLEIHTSLKEKDVLGKELPSLYPNINVTMLKRKIKTALRMQSPTFYIASTSKYLIPIKINQLKVSGFEHMRQDISVIPFSQDEQLVALIITDQTNMTSTNIKLESNVRQVEDLNKELLSEKKIIDERVLFLKIDLKYTLKDASRAYVNLLGYEKIDIIEQNLFKYERFTIENNLEAKIKKHAQEKKIFQYDKITLTHEGKDVWLANTLVPDYDKNGFHIGFVIFCENITSAKLVQEHQSRLLESSRSSAMGEMISMIAHQWRQPLSVINTIIATLKIKKELDMLDDKIIEESYTKIENTVAYLSETIDDFRNFFKKNKELQHTSVKDIFDKANHLLKAEMNVLNIAYTEKIDKTIEIITYKNEMVQTLINILKNSIDEFKIKPKIEQQINVIVEETSAHIMIKIEDNAGGISPQVLVKVFEPYFSTKSKNGTGLGLYVCKTIIEEHLKGKITMTSESNTTKTIIELPKVLIKNSTKETI